MWSPNNYIIYIMDVFNSVRVKTSLKYFNISPQCLDAEFTQRLVFLMNECETSYVYYNFTFQGKTK